jgi:hypothetical protein
MSIEKTYEFVKNRVQGKSVDSLEVVKQVEEYRQFWKPAQTNVVLLAESHVYTNDQDHKTECIKQLLNNFLPNYPTRYVRFVYCLGYGENEILNQQLEDNTGTPQYWKIFSSCISKNEHDLGFQRILKTENSLFQRLRNKIAVLQEMQKKGIRLLDASIVGIYRAKYKYETKERIIKICWDEHLKNVITELHPKYIVVIGKGVESILRWRLGILGIKYETLRQPQGDRGTSEQQLENYRKYQRICSKYCL